MKTFGQWLIWDVDCLAAAYQTTVVDLIFNRNSYYFLILLIYLNCRIHYVIILYMMYKLWYDQTIV